ncbi:MAG: UV DNA damage repair endonuclease UvsE [Acidobacteriota bacterium]|jgi:UV DNA damage endonuclease|nr:UV DNA damage repair endonuclease UvsE [Acidobacteriota bacterium]
MRIGYPCINRGIGCSAGTTFRLAGYSAARLREKIKDNLACLQRILEFNHAQKLLFFRISSDTVPFASHPVCDVDWAAEFSTELAQLGERIRRDNMRISMHPDQFVLINAEKSDIVDASIRELEYHAAFLDAMGLDLHARIQIHVGGLYNDREAALKRFVNVFESLPEAVRRRLSVENDDRRFSARDCLWLAERTRIPVICDNLHHRLLNHGESLREVMAAAAETWNASCGPPMVDYSSQYPGGRPGRHVEHLDAADFIAFLDEVDGLEFDLMLEVKDKEKSAMEARDLARARGRL